MNTGALGTTSPKDGMTPSVTVRSSFFGVPVVAGFCRSQRMKMYEVEVRGDGDLIFISQEDCEGEHIIALHIDQIPLITQWLKNEYCARGNGDVEIKFPE